MAAGALPVALLFALAEPSHEQPNLDLLVVPVFLVAYWRGRGPAITALVTVAVASDYWLLVPIGRFTVGHPGDRAEWLSLLGTSVLVIVLTEALHRSRREALERERLHAVTLASVGDGVVATDPTGRIRFLNREATRIAGFPDDSALGLPLASIFPWLAGAARDVLAAAQASEPAGAERRQSQTALTLSLERDGATLSIEAQLAPIVADHGAVEGVVVVLRDVSARVRAAAETQRWIDAFLNCGHGIAIGDPVIGTIQACNPAFAGILGRNVANIAGSPILSLYDPTSRGMVGDAIATADREGKAEYETRMCHADGSLVPVSVNLVSVKDAQGGVRYRVATVQDINERVRAAAATQRWIDAFLNCGHGIGIGDAASGAILACNPAYARLTGREPGELIGWPILRLYDPAQREDLRAAIAEADRSGRANLEIRMCHRDGSLVPVAIDLVSVRDVTGTVTYRVATIQDIRPREQALAQIRLQSRLLELAFEPTIVWELDGGITYWNRGAAQLYGFDAEHAVGRVTHELLETWEERGLGARLATLAETGAWSGVLVHRASDGHLLEVESRQRLVVDATGRKLVLESDRDATARRRTERKLLESEARLRLFIEHAPAAIAMFDPEMRYLAASKRWLDDYRLGQAELVGRSHYEVFPEIGDVWKDVHRRGIQGEVISAEADRFERADGSVQWVRWEVRPWSHTDGTIGGIVIFTEDITSRVEARQALEESEQRLQAVIENLNEATVISGLRGWLVHWNRASLEMFGFESNEELMESFPRLPELLEYMTADGEVLPMNRWPLARLLAGEPVHDLELRVRRIDLGTERHVIANGRRMRAADGGELAFVSLHDVTERARAAAALRERTQDLERSNKDLEQFAYVASHDLKEPLRAVAGCVALLERRYRGELGGRADELIQHAVDGATRMQQLIDDLLQFSRIGTRGGEFATFELEAALADAERNLEVAAAERGARITHDPLPVVAADRTQITSLLQNLLANALKFCGETPSVHLSASREGGDWVISVTDNGIGIAPEYFERIFGVFQRLHTRTEYPGTGIGLAICRKIVERHGGRIWLDSAVGAGSTFRFSLPARNRAVAAASR